MTRGSGAPGPGRLNSCTAPGGSHDLAVGLDAAAIEDLRTMILTQGTGQLAVGDLGADDLADLAWSGNPAHPRSVVAALQRAAQGLEAVLGHEHPETLIDGSNLANLTGEAGDAAGARDQLAALLPAQERVSGAEHPDTLTDRARLARWTGAAGNAAGARDQYAALLPVIERVLGPEHPETQAAREELAYWTDEADGDVSRGVK